jgi:hypothetical protein
MIGNLDDATAEALDVQGMLPRLRALLVEDVRVIDWLLAGRPAAAAAVACRVLWWVLAGWADDRRRGWVTWLRGLLGWLARRRAGTPREAGDAGLHDHGLHQHVHHGAQCRRVLLADLVGVARRLSDDELCALLMIAVRRRVGQTTTTASRTK